MTRSTRDTFMSYGDVLSEIADKCLVAETRLINHKHEANATWQSMIELVAEEEHHLALALKQYAMDGPEKIIATRLQYKRQDAPIPEPQTLGDAINNINRTNDEIASLLESQAEKFDGTELHDAFDELHDQIKAVGRKISMIRVTARDA